MLKEGMIIEGPFWSEPVEIKKLIEKPYGIEIIGATLKSNQYVNQIIRQSDLAKIKIKELTLNFLSPPTEVFLALEALRYRYASLFDPFLAMNVSKVDPLPFQIEAVYGYVLRLPKIRFLIADDPGAGKTIMAGLILKELKLRGIIERILLVVPGHLKDQWKRELKERFQENLTEVTRDLIDAHYGENIWEREKQIITSIDFAKKEDIRQALTTVSWDLVIVDEAHKLSAFRYGDKIEKTERYKLGEILSKNSKHLLFLTATPHRGDPENFRLLLDLLEPGFFATTSMLQESIEKRDNPLFIRRLKEDLRDFEGKPIFTNRYAKTLKYRLSSEEQHLYEELSNYVINQYNLALKNEKNSKRNIAFALLILQRRFASSTYALLQSLRRRKDRLTDLLKEGKFKTSKLFLSSEELAEMDDESETERESIEAKLETLTTARSPEELEKELRVIDELIRKCEAIIASGAEVKLNQLKEAIKEGLSKIEETGGIKKILIFTEFRDTLEYLCERIRSWGFSVTSIHGGMKLEERIRAEGEFRHKTQILVATDAAGEGINLQFCNILINYDLPWNPNRLEQRMGRIHRYGQQRDVFVFNIVAEDTREGYVFSKLFEKLEEIREALGSDKVFDIIGDVFNETKLYQLILEASLKAKTLEEITKEIESITDPEKMEKIKNALGESLATRYIDYTRIKEISERAKEYRLIPEYVEEFFKKAFSKAGGKLRFRKDGFLGIDSIPFEIKEIASNPKNKLKYGELLSSYSKITFDKDKAFRHPDAEFISFGHPLLEATLEWSIQNFSELLKMGAIFEDPDGRLNGFIYFYEGEVVDGLNEIAGKRVMAIYTDGSYLSPINPAIIWDFKPNSSASVAPPPPPLELIEKIEEQVYYEFEKYLLEVLKERQRQAEIKKKYGISSLEHFIRELDLDLVKLYEREMRGEKVDLAIRNKEERKRYYERALEKLKETIERETHLSISTPRFIGAIYVYPSTESMKSDEEIERMGMEIALAYERSQGRSPEDVSKENLGYDIRSKGKEGYRYIEVKARALTGDIALTPNEWFKAKRFRHQYWLYVVEGAGTPNPTLYLIQNPAESLEVVERIESVRFIIKEKEWKGKTFEKLSIQEFQVRSKP